MTGGIDVETVGSGERSEVVRLVAACQRRPDRHVCYLSQEAVHVGAELAELEPDGWDGHLVARRDGRIVGALAVEHDTDPPRVWWHGPFVADDEPFGTVADALLVEGRRRLPAHVTQEELGPDDRHVDLAAVAGRHGFHADPASAVLSRATSPPLDVADPPGVVVRPFVDDDRGPVATLVGEAFPASHVPGSRIDEGTDRLVLVAEREGAVIGFVAAERQEDGGGYLDLVAVAVAVRGGGIGAALVAAAVAELTARFGCDRVHLTVRGTNGAARALYDRLGFTEERLIRPFRRGFSIA